MHLVVTCESPNYCPNLSAADIRAKNPIWNFDKGVPLFVSIPYQGFLKLKVSINCNKLKIHSPVWCRSLEVSEPSGSFPVLNQTCQNLYFFREILTLMDYHAKGLWDEEFMSHDWGRLMFPLSIALSYINQYYSSWPFMPPMWLGVYLLLASQGYKSICHLINTADESIWIPNLNRLLITLFMPYHLNITSDVFVVWL